MEPKKPHLAAENNTQLRNVTGPGTSINP